MKKGLWILFATLSILVGLYPSIYYIMDKQFGLLNSKSEALINDTLYIALFYTHITFGGLALLIGWTQFITAFKNKQLTRHRTIGKIYVGAVFLSALAGLYIAVFATGGLITAFGFAALAITWLSTTLMALRAIRNRQISFHQRLMIYSYAACFAAVTLCIWLPLLTSLTGDFFVAYKIVAWLCWVPNMFVAYFITQRLGDYKPSMLTSTAVVNEEEQHPKIRGIKRTPNNLV